MSPKATPSGVPTKITSIRLPDKLITVVDRDAKKDKVSRNAKIQQIIETHYNAAARTHSV